MSENQEENKGNSPRCGNPDLRAKENVKLQEKKELSLQTLFREGLGRTSAWRTESWAVCMKIAPAQNLGWVSLPASLSLRTEERGTVGLKHRYFYKSVPEKF